jgi:diguanylate cyclase (GGDEF)-like protein
METLREEELRQIRLFQSVDLDAIKGILDACTIRSLGAGEVLIVAGQDNRTVYFLIEGHVRIHLTSIRNQPTAILGPGESVGEMSVIDHKPASAFVVAAEPVRLLAMEEEILWSLVHSSHAAASNLLIGLSTRLRDADAVISDSRETDPDYLRYGMVDALTGLHNRHWLEMILDRQVQRAAVSRRPLSLIMIDIDHFKTFNDHYGHAYGDHVLYAVAHTLSDYLRPTEVIARYGGDEFVVVLPEMGFETARDISGRLHRAVMNAVPVTPNGSAIPHPTISIGLATLKEGQTGADLVAEADQALNRAKNKGQNSTSA